MTSLHVGGFQELQPAELHERNVAPAQLDLEQVRMVGRPHQHRLPLEIDPGFPVLQHPGDDVIALRLFVFSGDVDRPLCRGPGRKKVLAELFAGTADHGVGGVEDRLDGTVIVLERDDRGWRC